MRFFSCKTVVLTAALLMSLQSADVIAATKQQTSNLQKVSLLGGRLVFRLPKDYVKSPMPEIDDKATLDGIIAATVEQQKASYQNFKQLGEKKMVRRGLGVRQLDISGSVDGGKVLSSTVTAAAGKRTAMINVISLEKDAKAHGELLKAITDNKK